MQAFKEYYFSEQFLRKLLEVNFGQASDNYGLLLLSRFSHVQLCVTL